MSEDSGVEEDWVVDVWVEEGEIFCFRVENSLDPVEENSSVAALFADWSTIRVTSFVTRSSSLIVVVSSSLLGMGSGGGTSNNRIPDWVVTLSSLMNVLPKSIVDG